MLRRHGPVRDVEERRRLKALQLRLLPEVAQPLEDAALDESLEAI
jgi:hypothetical protein